jgi:hypothetical protein
MMYFWLIPALLLVAILVWALYAAATKRAIGRTQGKVVTDKSTTAESPDRLNP